VDQPSTRNHGKPAQCELLFQIHIVVQALAVGLRRKVHISHKSVFILHAISERCMRPDSFRIVSLILEPSTIDPVDFVRRGVEDSRRITVHVELVITIKVVESGEAMLPPVRRRHR
jgi:hypothetical protein